ncbi:choice-of-anchor K domain-containing protein [Streptomyces daliensis]|uniref:Lamin tail domain-containing protein n=1 Tax=Streptomyces daliensis TaxID=299421 RepID=A0A8T4IR83_9ACTN|nr:lamin tail domain-containing protein [Streptomyces daliensis]
MRAILTGPTSGPGAPDSQGRLAGVRFTGTTADAPLDGREFTLGTVTIDNYVREGLMSFERIPLRLDIQLEVEGGPTQTFKPYAEYHAVNDQDQDSADTLALHRYPTSESFTLDGVPYALVLAGFAAEEDRPLPDALHVPEGRSSTAELRGMLVRADRLDVAIRTVRFKGEVAGSQADEYIEIVNRSAIMAPADGWVVNAGDFGQEFTFPSGTGALLPGVPLRIYTNEVHPEWGGHSFASKSAIWNDKGDTAEIRNTKNTVIARYAYGAAAD